jgi:hypothetical protein
MWDGNEITVELVEIDGAAMLVLITTPVGKVEVLANVTLAGRTLYVREAHIQGLNAGALGRAGLNAIGRKVLEEIDADEIVIEGSTRTTGKNPGRRPRPIRYPRV